jgi:hypothetical protein
MLLGHPTHLKAKARGENSMSEKARCSKAAKLHAGRDPDGMVKAKLLEPQCPSCKGIRLEMADEIQLPSNRRMKESRRKMSGELLTPDPRTPREQVASSDMKDTNRAPKPF